MVDDAAMTLERDQVLDAAFSVLADVGPDAFSHELVARELDCDAASVRALFPDLGHMQDEVLREKTEPIISTLAVATQDSDDASELVEALFRIVDRFMLDEPRYPRMMIRWAMSSGDSITKFFQRSIYPSETFERIQHFIDDGQLDLPDPFALFTLVDPLVFFAHMYRSSLEKIMPEKDMEDILEERAALALRALRSGIVRAKR